MNQESPLRPASAFDALADRHAAAGFSLDPVLATSIGVLTHDTEWTDYSPDGATARADLARSTLAELDGLIAADSPRDDIDDVGVSALRERLGLELELAEAGLNYGDLNVIASPPQSIRDVLDLMPTATLEDWTTISTRLAGLPEAVDGYLHGLRRAVAEGRPPAIRQVHAVVAQCLKHAHPDTGFFVGFVAGARPDGGDPPPALAADLAERGRAAAQAYAGLARVLREEIAPRARQADACGEEVYSLWSRYFLGARIDLAETYEWGLAELAAIEAEMSEVAARITGQGDVDEAVRVLDADPSRRLIGTEALRSWMQQTSDEAVEGLAGVHFDIPDQIRRLECLIAPTEEGGIYYTGPSEDFSRPGRMWWSVPADVTSFTTWRQRTIVYHEGVPGHHLQVGQTMVRADTLNRWRRLTCWTSGHGEGWALYAERLMGDLGFLDDPGDRLGMLDSSAFRAARVVVDIGTHCGFEAPEEVGGGVWDADKMWQFLCAHVRQDRAMLEFEHLRYLGWPGQAPSYKVGERLWVQARERARAQDPDGFDLKAFHRRALDLGSLGLDVMQAALLAHDR